jgi:hypothetical protein
MVYLFPLWVQLCIQTCHPIGLFRNRSSCVSVCIQNGSNVTPVSSLVIFVEHYFIVHYFHCNSSPSTSLYRGSNTIILLCFHFIIAAVSLYYSLVTAVSLYRAYIASRKEFPIYQPIVYRGSKTTTLLCLYLIVVYSLYRGSTAITLLCFHCIIAAVPS